MNTIDFILDFIFSTRFASGTVFGVACCVVFAYFILGHDERRYQ